MSWPAAREALVGRLDGLSLTAFGFTSETLMALEYPPNTAQTNHPYAYVIPPARTISRRPTRHRVTEFPEVRVRLVLGGRSAPVEDMSRRMEAWVEALANAFDGAVSLTGKVDVIQSQEFSALQLFENEGWGFEMSLQMRLSEIREFAA